VSWQYWLSREKRWPDLDGRRIRESGRKRRARGGGGGGRLRGPVKGLEEGQGCSVKTERD